MRNKLNRLVAEGDLLLKPFSDEGVSVNRLPQSGAVLFVMADDRARVLRLYSSIAPAADFVKTAPELLLDLLVLAGPASPWPHLRLGLDPRARFLWASAALSYEDASAPKIREVLERFEADAQGLSQAVLARISRAAGEAAPSSPDPLPNSSARTQSPASSGLGADDLQLLMQSPNVLWG